LRSLTRIQRPSPLLDVRAAWFLVTGYAFSDPLLNPALGVFDVPALGGLSNDAFKRHAG
jgi:hypothetical protein